MCGPGPAHQRFVVSKFYQSNHVFLTRLAVQRQADLSAVKISLAIVFLINGDSWNLKGKNLYSIRQLSLPIPKHDFML